MSEQTTYIPEQTTYIPEQTIKPSSFEFKFDIDENVINRLMELKKLKELQEIPRKCNFVIFKSGEQIYDEEKGKYFMTIQSQAKPLIIAGVVIFIIGVVGLIIVYSKNYKTAFALIVLAGIVILIVGIVYTVQASESNMTNLIKERAKQGKLFHCTRNPELDKYVIKNR